MQSDITTLAQSCGVDPITVEQAALAVCRRLIAWHGDAPIDTSREIIEAALMDHVDTVKSMALGVHMNRDRFARQVLGLIAVND